MAVGVGPQGDGDAVLLVDVHRALGAGGGVHAVAAGGGEDDVQLRPLLSLSTATAGNRGPPGLTNHAAASSAGWAWLMVATASPQSPACTAMRRVIRNDLVSGPVGGTRWTTKFSADEQVRLMYCACRAAHRTSVMRLHSCCPVGVGLPCSARSSQSTVSNQACAVRATG
jgi:hypothetical protein